MNEKNTETNLAWYEKKSKQKFDSKGRKVSSEKKSNKKRDEEFTQKNNSRPDFSSPKKTFDKKNNHKKVERKNYSPTIVATELDKLFDFSSLDSEARKILNDFQGIINSTHPLNSRQRALIYEQIRDLSHGLTDQRGERRLGYMNQPSTLSAYVHYFLWWNLVRLTRLFSNLSTDFLELTEDDVCLDVGSGPLTVPLALYISRPELRSKKLKWYCMDISSQALSIGENLMMTISAKMGGEMWNITRVKGNFGTAIKEKATFISCANVFNEIIEDRQMPPDFQAKNCTENILAYADSKTENTKVLLIEPGVPNSARLLSLMRASFMRKGFVPLSPCPHCGDCPMEGKKGGKWCNFAFSTEEAPAALKKISEKAYLPKDRAVLSFVALKKAEQKKEDLDNLIFRVASDPIRLPGNRTGYYACSRIGLLLIVTTSNLLYGDALSIPMPKNTLKQDEKSGAYILELN